MEQDYLEADRKAAYQQDIIAEEYEAELYAKEYGDQETIEDLIGYGIGAYSWHVTG